MTNLLWILVLLVGAVLLSSAARRIKVPSPSLLALGGIALALLPDVPRFSLDPELALALFVAPVLVDGAFDSSLYDLRDNWFPVTCLVFMAVATCTLAVAFVSHWLVPAMPWAVAVALGAAVAPPDAAAAIAVLREVRLPRRLLAILENESLLNDASALLIYRLAVGAALMHHGDKVHVVATLTMVLAGSVVAGVVFAILFGTVVNSFSHPPSAIVLQFIGAFAVWILADRLALSGVLVTVTFALVISRRSAINLPAAIRVPSYAVWEAAVFVLNALAFILMGLQLGPIMDHVGPEHRGEYIRFAVIVLGTAILARGGWVFTYSFLTRLVRHFLGTRSRLIPPPVKNSTLVSWCGMRGIVTLAAAIALPDGSGSAPAFPYRDLIVLTSFVVVVGTLIIQGFTLRPLVMLLRLEDNAPVGGEIQAGRREMFVAALQSLDDEDSAVAAALRIEFSRLIDRIDGSPPFSPETRQTEIDLRARARAASRERINHLRDIGVLGEQAFQQLEAELDTVELNAEVRSRW